MALTLLPSAADPDPTPRSGSTTPILRAEGARHVIALYGNLDLSIQRDLCDLLALVVAFGVGDVVIDLREATFVSSTIVRCMAIGHELLVSNDRKLTFRSPSTPVVRWLLVFGLTALIEPAELVQW